MNYIKRRFPIFFGMLLFGALGVYLTFFSGSSNQFDSQTTAYRIEPNETHDHDSEIIYQPTYYFTVDGKNYSCTSKTGSNSYPSDSKNKVFYDSSDPMKCRTEYEKSSNFVFGIICLVTTGIIIIGLIMDKRSSNRVLTADSSGIDISNQPLIDPNIANKIYDVAGKANYIYKKVAFGIAILVVLVLILLNSLVLKQTIKARNYEETIAVYTGEQGSESDDVFTDYKYIFKDKLGNEHVISIFELKENPVKKEVKVKYDANNPDNYYDEGSLLDKKGKRNLIIEVIILIILVFIFFNKRILTKIPLVISIG